MKTVVEFVELKRPEKALHLCRLADSFFQQGHRVLITVEDDNQGVTLDRFMWSWKKTSFLPHAYDNGAIDCLDEPVVITADMQNTNGATILIMGAATSIDFVRQFQHVISFVEMYDEQLKSAARDRFQQYREAGFAPRMRQ